MIRHAGLVRRSGLVPPEPRSVLAIVPPATVPFAALVAALLTLCPADAMAQYFGRNKVQYEEFDFRVMVTPHFDIHFYPEAEQTTRDAARMSERWYSRLSSVLNHTVGRRSLIYYANHPDFQQTNVIGGAISEGTGGVTEGLRGRVVLPFTGVYRDNDHVIGHELVHVFQYDLVSAPNGPGLQGIGRVPLWLVEGMAEYLSIGRDDPQTAMWLRDAALRNDLPTLKQLTTDGRYFPYRYGQALWAYIAGRWGDPVIVDVYRAATRRGWERAFPAVLGLSTDSLSKVWHAAIRETYLPAIAGRARPTDAGDVLLKRDRKTGEMNLAPSLSPDGRYMAFFSSRELFSIDLFVADATTGRVVKRLTSPQRTGRHIDALSFLATAGTWSPDARKFAFVVFAEGNNELAILDVDSRDIERRIAVRGVGEIRDPSWSPDGSRIVFSGSAGGISDLYLLDVASGEVRQLTSDRHADLQPSWSPDGRTIAFASDRGPETDFQRLTYSPMQIALLDVGSGAVRTLPLFARAKHINPQFGQSNDELYFISDRGGYADVYRTQLGSGELFQVTRVATGVSGVTALSPALSVARQTGRLAFSVFDNAGYAIVALPPERARGEPAAALAEQETFAGILPPVRPTTRPIVEEYLRDPLGGLPAEREYAVTEYDPRLRLDYVGSPGVGIAYSSFGTAVGGGIATYFSDQLGNRSLGATLQTGNLTSYKDLGGEVFFANLRRRWNWGVSASHVPYVGGFTTVQPADVDVNGRTFRGQLVEQRIQRMFVDQLSGLTRYPFSVTRRFEASLGVTRLGFDTEVEQIMVVSNQIVGRRRADAESPPPITYAQAAMAFVGDNSFFAFTSPVAGHRFRFEAAPTFGQFTFQTLLADYRRYFFMRPLTFAMRGLHFGRFGRDAESDELTPLFLGYETLVRGYASESFSTSECRTVPDGSSECPVFERLVGSRIAVASMELRIPLLGTREFGLLPFFLPVEFAPFVDVGAAWRRGDPPALRFDRETNDRVPVASAGLSARINLLGYAVLEAYYVNPFHRPLRGPHIGFQLAPGW